MSSAEEIYASGRELNRYPYDAVVRFVFSNISGRPAAVRLLEIGCGAGNNLWFAAREGLAVSGVDLSPTAIAYAQNRLRTDGLDGDLRVGDFRRLPWPDGSFDLVVDRCALCYVDLEGGRAAVAEICRVMSPGGRVFLNPYSARHTADLGGRLAPMTFYSEGDIDEVLAGLHIVERTHVSIEFGDGTIAAEWRVVAELPT